MKTEVSIMGEMNEFQQTHRELLLQILQIVDDNIQCKFVCKFWKSIVEGAERKVENCADDTIVIHVAKLAARGQLDLLKWAHSQSHDNFIRWHSTVPMAAAKFGHFHIVDWYLSLAEIASMPADVAGYFAKWGRVDFLQEYVDINDADARNIINYKAGRHHRIDVMDWIDEKYGESSSAVIDRCSGAVKSRDIPLLKILGKNGFLILNQTDRASAIEDLLDLCCNSQQDWLIWHQYAVESYDAEMLTEVIQNEYAP